ncbi:MAG: ATP-binding protein [Patescibacteria group bacterium]|jgi:predicted AAA+ superfamily ATPase|nr:ATP-binding protein [Patescibacteria group bacterium]
MQIKREIQDILQKSLFQGRVVILYGARQVGKTTLVKNVMTEYREDALYLNCDEIDVRQALTDKTSTELKAFIGDKRLVVIDEAQRVKNIGLTLKLLIDNFPNTQIIATGSSSFELSGKIKEPLTGRKTEFFLFPFSIKELTQVRSPLEIKRSLEDLLIFGSYPGVFLASNEREKIVRELATSYSYKDVLVYQDIRNPELLEKLLQALALQIGSEVSYSKLAQLLGVNKITIENYVRVLEQAYIIFRVGPFSRNIRNELKKKRKIYFYDVGLRNALINNFNPLSLRQDVGALWENFLVIERMKKNNNLEIINNIYFWRTTTGKEIDYIEEADGVLTGYEFKWHKKTFIAPKEFLENYENSKVNLVNKDNFLDFIL